MSVDEKTAISISLVKPNEKKKENRFKINKLNE